MSNPSPRLTYQSWKRLHDASAIVAATITSTRQAGVGWVNALIPFAQKLYGADTAGMTALLKRHNGFYGGYHDFHPLALGAVARAEWEIKNEEANPENSRNLREWCSTALQLFGWQLFRDGIRPLVLIIGLIIGLFAYHSSNASRALAVMTFLLIYNIPVWSFRLWSVGYGWKKGTDLPQAFGQWNWTKLLWSIRWLGAGLVGVAFVLTAREWGRIVFILGAHGAEELAWVTVGIGFLLGYLLQPRIHTYALLILLIASVLGMSWLL